MKINKKRKKISGVIPAPFIIAIFIAVTSGLITNYVWSTMTVKNPESDCTTAYNNSYNAMLGKKPKKKEEIIFKRILDGIYLCCIQGRGKDYHFDWSIERCVANNSNG